MLPDAICELRRLYDYMIDFHSGRRSSLLCRRRLNFPLEGSVGEPYRDRNPHFLIHEQSSLHSIAGSLLYILAG